jgi:hypothetical protein
VDAACGQVEVRPAKREHLAGTQAGQGADRVGDVQRLGEREEDPAHVVEPFDEGRLLRVVRRADQPHQRLGQATRWVAGREPALGEVDENRGEERDEDADGRGFSFSASFTSTKARMRATSTVPGFRWPKCGSMCFYQR